LHNTNIGNKGKIRFMHFATVHRMARLCRFFTGRSAIHHYHRNYRRYCRLAMGIFVISGALLFSPTALFAQNDGPVRTPIEEISPAIAPVESELAGSETVASTPADLTDLIHEIGVGDTLTNVAQRYNIKVADLAAYNQILDYNHIVLGQKLRIPPIGVTVTAPAAELAAIKPGADGYHVVRKGESLGAIARLYNMTLEELMALNEVDDPNLVQMGTMLRLTDEVEPPTNALQPEIEVITYTVKRGDTLSEIAQMYYTTAGQLLADNKLTDADVRVGQELRIFPPATALEAFGIDASADSERWILIDLSDQSLTAYQGETVLMYSIVSTGKDATPTRVGEFAIYQKLESQHMTGEDYDLPGVPWVMYYDDEMAMHGAYWHANFGIPTSHGCTNMTIPEAQALYSWAPIGTRVVVQP
jgi:LysM repeat protein